MVMTDVEDRAKHSDLPVYGRLREVVCLVESVEPLYVRYSEDPRRDVGGASASTARAGFRSPACPRARSRRSRGGPGLWSSGLPGS